MNTFIELWYVWVTLFAIGLVAGYNLNKFIKKPRKEQIEAIKKWLVKACIEAEAMWDDDTGYMKLLETYGWFVEKFPAIATLVSFETFKSWVDEALEEAKKLMENPTVSWYVNKQ